MIDVIETEQAPKAMGPYAQGRVFDNRIYTAGQIGLDPKTMQMVEGTEARIARVFSNDKAIARGGGGDLSSILKLVVYPTGLARWPLVNTAMIDRFKAPSLRCFFQLVRQFFRGTQNMSAQHALYPLVFFSAHCGNAAILVKNDFLVGGDGILMPYIPRRA